MAQKVPFSVKGKDGRWMGGGSLLTDQSTEYNVLDQDLPFWLSEKPHAYNHTVSGSSFYGFLNS